jgi:hypothetical protein
MDTGIPQHVLAKVVRGENGKFTSPITTNSDQRVIQHEIPVQPQNGIDFVEQSPVEAKGFCLCLNRHLTG